jgi:uncharacterized membrane protein YccF (DUF307 family)
MCTFGSCCQPGAAHQFGIGGIMQKIGWSVVALAAIVVALALPVSASHATAPTH